MFQAQNGCKKYYIYVKIQLKKLSQTGVKEAVSNATDPSKKMGN